MKRTVIKINETLCNGCGTCVSSCHEGALQLINGKARIVNDAYCDGLGACIGECPVGAIELEERDAEAFNETAAIEAKHIHAQNHTCPGSRQMLFAPAGTVASQLRQWPVQLHLLNPQAQYFHSADVVIAADCTAFACGDFHSRFLKNHMLAIACPKLDSGKEIYLEKITAMIEHSGISSITAVVMEVPCCGGLLQLVKQAAERASRKVPIKKVVINIQGEIIEES